jgi:hypothetical protein
MAEKRASRPGRITAEFGFVLAEENEFARQYSLKHVSSFHHHVA